MSHPPRHDNMMHPALPSWSNSKTRRSEMVMELSSTQPPPLFPIELQGYVSPDKWENRVRALTRIASRYSKPMLERYWILLSLILTFIIPPVAYYTAIDHFNLQEEGKPEDQRLVDGFVWESRLIAFGVTLAVWFVMFMPVVVWKHIGFARVNRMVDGWARDDVRTASSFAAISTWKVTMPGIFRDGIVLVVSYPVPPSTFDLESYLPPYIANLPEAAPSYDTIKRLSSLQAGKFGEIPLYDDSSKGVAV